MFNFVFKLFSALLVTPFFITDINECLIQKCDKFPVSPSQSIINIDRYSNYTLLNENLEILSNIKENQNNNITLIASTSFGLSEIKKLSKNFPYFSYWITEDGGKIFKMKPRTQYIFDSDLLKEIERLGDIPTNFSDISVKSSFDFEELYDWSEHVMENNIDNFELLESLKEFVHYEFNITTNGNYMTKIEINGNTKELNKVIDILPANFTYFLSPSEPEHEDDVVKLIVKLPKSDLNSAINWLVKRINIENNNNEEISYSYLGNNIEVINNSTEAFVNISNLKGKFIYFFIISLLI